MNNNEREIADMFVKHNKITSKFPIDMYVSKLLLYHLRALSNFLSFWCDSPMARNESLNFSLSQSSLAICFFFLAYI